ncbi:FAD-dependent oxidoreductase [Halobacteria archaeon AArc-m2/3/4]|uniref:FAD-dependent oxidoreductase n=1 Tax=Natronoglomus mannanivorans TaxID=2979990 RepID=A0AAP2YYG9_9EURY|nr:FAD-dependent oxidoreductase [Halobacteria archaeon AArc-xg1-1]MCU4975205.1 FAD-dependent oxidoreductase [Halobacteria archaeon AArc-m2/3/4]
MTDVIVVGGGPAGLSAGLFTAKNGLETTVFDTDKTWMHKAHLFNYLGLESEDGTQFVEDSREQVDEFGVERVQGEQVTSVETDGDGFTVETEDGESEYEYEADYVVFATGTNRGLAEDLGCETTEDGPIEVDIDMETSVDDAYATGATARAEKWQAIISAGDGAAAALDILSKEKGERFHDFDVPADAE